VVQTWWGGESGGGGRGGVQPRLGGGGGGWYEWLVLKAFILSANEMPPYSLKEKLNIFLYRSAVTAD
jgi:hypothetical protein